MAPFATSARSTTLLLSVLLCVHLCSEVCVLQCGAAAIGINYGQVGNNLPTPTKVGKVRIYDVNPQVMAAFGGTGIEIIVTVPNDLVRPMAASAGQAAQWVATNIRPYFPATRVTGIAVGTDDDEALKASLVPAMRNLHAALAQFGMDGYVHISTDSSLGVLANSYPPSADHVANSLAAASSAPPYPSGDVPALSDHGAHLPSDTSTESTIADGPPDPVFSPYEHNFMKWWWVPVVLAALIAVGAGAWAVHWWLKTK